MAAIIGVCGINCAECEGYLATQAGDLVQLEQVAARWRVQHNNPGITAAYATCDGCTSTTGRLGGHCADCRIRNCPSASGLPNCAHCDSYESCEMLLDFFKYVPAAKLNLDLVRQSLAAD